jgi:hypothetical protein
MNDQLKNTSLGKQFMLDKFKEINDIENWIRYIEKWSELAPSFSKNEIISLIFNPSVYVFNLIELIENKYPHYLDDDLKRLIVKRLIESGDYIEAGEFITKWKVNDDNLKNQILNYYSKEGRYEYVTDFIHQWGDENNPNLIVNTYLKISLSKKSYQPTHPNNIVIENPTWTERDIWNYYNNNKFKLLKYLKGFNVMLWLKPNDNIVIIKNDPKTHQPIKIENEEDFDRWNNGRVVEFHIVLPSDYSKIAWIDFDVHSKWDRKNLKDVIKMADDLVKKNFEVNKTELFETGGRGYHLFIFFKQPQNINETRKKLKELLDNEIVPKYDKVTTSIVPSEDYLRLDVSTFHKGGSIRCPFSINSRSGKIEKQINFNEIK